MSLSEIWLNTPTELSTKTIAQIVSLAGDGKLRDNSVASDEVRTFLRIIPSELLKQYLNQCLEEKFDNSGLVLQDIVNEVGKRLDFEVIYGRYRGVPGQIGYDGIWKTIEGNQIVIEVKTTDAYRIDLNTIANYRRELIKKDAIPEEKISILIIVGRKDTGDLESQVRGSRMAWDVRIISMDSLVKLLETKEKVEDPRTIKRIHEILRPMEYTRIDSIVELLFSTAEEAIRITDVEAEEDEENEGKKGEGKKFTPVAFRESCIERYRNIIKKNLVKKSYALYETEDQVLGILCLTSKEYAKPDKVTYWYAFHPHQKEYLDKYKEKAVLFACGSEKTMIKIPYELFVNNIEKCNRTILEDERFYWHIHIHCKHGRYSWKLKKEFDDIDITGYLI